MWRGQNYLAVFSSALCTSSAEHLERSRATEKMKTRELRREGANYDSIYICSSTLLMTAGCRRPPCRLVEAVLAGEVPVLWEGTWAPGKEVLGGGRGKKRGSSESWARPEESGTWRAVRNGRGLQPQPARGLTHREVHPGGWGLQGCGEEALAAGGVVGHKRQGRGGKAVRVGGLIFASCPSPRF